MRAPTFCLTVLFSGGLLVGCGDDDGGPQRLEDRLVDTWDIASFGVVSRADPADSRQLIGGFSSVRGYLTISHGLTFSLVTIEAGGMWEITGSGWLDIIDGDVEVDDFTMPGTVLYEPEFVVDGSTLLLEQVGGTYWYDFDDDGQDEPADANAVLHRTTNLKALDLDDEWVATRCLFISQPSRADTVDLLALGGSMEVDMFDDGRYASRIVYPTDTEHDSGVFIVDLNRLVMISENQLYDPVHYEFNLSGNVLTIVRTTSYDFDNDGSQDAATFEARLERSAI